MNKKDFEKQMNIKLEKERYIDDIVNQITGKSFNETEYNQNTKEFQKLSLDMLDAADEEKMPEEYKQLIYRYVEVATKREKLVEGLTHRNAFLNCINVLDTLGLLRAQPTAI